MPGLVVFGAQWGDEGKGRFVDFLAAKADAVIRYQGGNNAGHTVIVDGATYKLHLLPSGVLSKGKICMIGNGVVVDPKALFSEIEEVEQNGIKIENLYVSDRAHLVMPYHIALDIASEESLKQDGIGTTKKGIGPCYTDKIARTGIRVCDLMNKEVFEKLLKLRIEEKNELLHDYGIKPLDFKEVFDEYLTYAEKLKPLVCDTSVLAHKLLSEKKNLLFEGAQGMLLDIDFGTYPYVTSSHPTTCGVYSGIGLGPAAVSEVVGVVKAYTTRVGLGPFVTELNDEIGSAIREKGNEYGATTGRPRRCGWLDLVMLKYAVRVNGITSIALSRMDTLGGFKKVQICTGYEIDGKTVNDFPASLHELNKATAKYIEMNGWDDQIAHIRNYDDLPENARKYIEFIEKQLGVSVGMIGVGPGREQCVLRTTYYK